MTGIPDEILRRVVRLETAFVDKTIQLSVLATYKTHKWGFVFHDESRNDVSISTVSFSCSIASLPCRTKVSHAPTSRMGVINKVMLRRQKRA